MAKNTKIRPNDHDNHDLTKVFAGIWEYGDLSDRARIFIRLSETIRLFHRPTVCLSDCMTHVWHTLSSGRAQPCPNAQTESQVWERKKKGARLPKPPLKPCFFVIISPWCLQNWTWNTGFLKCKVNPHSEAVLVGTPYTDKSTCIRIDMWAIEWKSIFQYFIKPSPR